jgi:hypothetical protein
MPLIAYWFNLTCRNRAGEFEIVEERKDEQGSSVSRAFLAHSLSHLLIYSFSHSLIVFIYSFMHSVTLSLIPSLTCSLAHSHTRLSMQTYLYVICDFSDAKQRKYHCFKNIRRYQDACNLKFVHSRSY